MIALFVAASVLPVQIACTNCNGVGYFEVECPRCAGRGRIQNPSGRVLKLPSGSLTSTIPCPACVKGASRLDKTGTGKKRVTCKLCNGRKKIRK